MTNRERIAVRRARSVEWNRLSFVEDRDGKEIMPPSGKEAPRLNSKIYNWPGIEAWVLLCLTPKDRTWNLAYNILYFSFRAANEQKKVEERFSSLRMGLRPVGTKWKVAKVSIGLI